MAKFPVEQIQAAAAVLPSLVAEACRRLLLPEGLKFREQRSVRRLSAVANEGACMIKTEFWPDWPEAGISWQAINTLLEQREKELPAEARVDEKAEQVLLPCTLWQGIEVDRDDLIIDLGLLCAKVSTSPEMIIVDRGSAYRIFGEFYGEVPRLQAV